MKKLITSVTIAGMVLCFGGTTLAATWYKDWIVLPRTGSMKTTDRQATSNTAYTKVTQNAYKINSRITKKGGAALTSWKGSGAGDTTAHSHKHGVKGTQIKAEFKTSVVNYNTTTATIHWAP